MRRLVSLASAVVLVDTMLYAALVPLLPRYADRFELSKGEAGLLVAAFAAGTLAAAVPGGLVAARYGPKRAVLSGLAIMSAASVGFALADSAAALGAARFVQGLGSALSWAGALAWLVTSAPRARRGELLGTALGAAVFGALLGPVLGGVAGSVGATPTFSGVAVLGALLGAAAWRTPTPPVPPSNNLSLGETARGALRDRVLLGGLWLVTLPAFLFGMLAVLAPLELGSSGFGSLAIGAVFVSGAALEATLGPLLGRVSDRRGRRGPLQAALVASTVVSLGLAWAARPAFVVVLVIAAAVSYGAFWAPAMALLADGAEQLGLPQGVAFGFMNAAWAGGNVAGPALGGVLAEVAGDVLPFGLAAGVCLATFAAVRRRSTLAM